MGINPLFLLGLPIVTAAGGGGGGTSPQAQQFFDRLPDAPNAGRKTAYSALIDGLVTDGVWAKLDGIRVAGATLGNDKTNLKNGTFDATVVGTPDFVANKGVLGNGLVDQFNPATQVPLGSQYTQNNASVWGWSLTPGPVGGYFVGNVYTRVDPYGGSAHTVYRVDSGPVTAGNTVTTTDGFWGANRTTQTLMNLWLNGAKIDTDTSNPSSAVPDENIHVENASRCACIAYGAGLTDVQAAALYTRVNAYLTTVGAFA